MSGSNSSARDAAPEPLGLTVHDIGAPASAADPRVVRSGRLKMLLVFAFCAAPVVLSYLSFYLWRPQAGTNYGTLIAPTRSLPALSLQRLDGSRVDAAALRGQWLLVAVGDARCDAACERRLYVQRQLREMLGRERERLDKVWFVTGAEPPSPALRDAVLAAPGMTLLHARRDELAAWLAPEAGRSLDEHLYLVDPMGEWMMRMPVDADPTRVKRDLERLLRASASWDRAGR